MLFNRDRYFFLADQHNMPLMVKYSDDVFYLPLFESMEEAAFAQKSLATNHTGVIQQPPHQLTPVAFSWANFKQYQQHLKQQGHMLFVYPMAPNEYGRN